MSWCCEYDERCFDTCAELRSHQRNRHPLQPWVICDQPPSLPYCCQTCAHVGVTVCFATWGELQMHMQTHVTPTPPPPLPPPPPVGGWCCEYDGKCFDTCELLRAHQLASHADVPIVICEQPPGLPYCCQVCAREGLVVCFATWEEYQEHMVGHEWVPIPKPPVPPSKTLDKINYYIGLVPAAGLLAAAFLYDLARGFTKKAKE